ncbi:MAG: hypothetical protein GC149_20335 [Gammaproteobacteria bacterium]|nr:hypothetical protein [Gammaproteobacteria bacterium]
MDAAIASGLMSRVNQNTPYGTVTYNQIGSQTVGTGSGARDVPLYEQNVNLNPTTQQTLDAQQALALALSNKANTLSSYVPTDRFTLDGITPAPSSTDFSADRDKISQDVYDRAMNLMRPQYDQQRRSLDQQVADRGLPINGEAAKTMYGNLDRSQNEAMNQLALSAALAGGDEQNRLFNLQTQAHQQGINDTLLQRTQPFNELSAFIQGSPAIQSLQAMSTPTLNVAPADIMGQINQNYANSLNSYNNQVAQQQSGMNGLFGLAGSLGSALIMSDRDVKRDIVSLGMWNGFKWYAFRYLWSPAVHFGVMAQEVIKKRPDAVFRLGGVMAVNYAKLEA